MKVVCEYCGSYVEADENMRCPLCLAELGSSVRTEQDRVDQQEEEERQRVAEEKAQEAKDEHISEVIKGIAGVATAFVAGRATTADADERDDDWMHGERPPEPPDGRFGRTQDGRPPEPPDGRHARSGMGENGRDGFAPRGGHGGPGGPGGGRPR